MWYNSGLLQARAPGHSQDRGGKRSPAGLAQEWGQTVPRARGQGKGPGTTLLSQTLTVWKLLQPVAPSCPSPLTPKLPKGSSFFIKARVTEGPEATALLEVGCGKGQLSPWD